MVPNRASWESLKKIDWKSTMALFTTAQLSSASILFVDAKIFNIQKSFNKSWKFFKFFLFTEAIDQGFQKLSPIL